MRALSGLAALVLLFASTAVQAEAGSAPSRVDLNQATAEQLEALPGIGAAKAAAIVAHRKASGAFSSIEDLEAVRGIGPALVTKLRPHVTLGSRGRSKSSSKTGSGSPASRSAAAK